MAIKKKRLAGSSFKFSRRYYNQSVEFLSRKFKSKFNLNFQWSSIECLNSMAIAIVRAYVVRASVLFAGVGLIGRVEWLPRRAKKFFPTRFLPSCTVRAYTVPILVDVAWGWVASAIRLRAFVILGTGKILTDLSRRRLGRRVVVWVRLSTDITGASSIRRATKDKRKKFQKNVQRLFVVLISCILFVFFSVLRFLAYRFGLVELKTFVFCVVTNSDAFCDNF